HRNKNSDADLNLALSSMLDFTPAPKLDGFTQPKKNTRNAYIETSMANANAALALVVSSQGFKSVILSTFSAA
ncbi:MAG: hypothetical protein M3Z14_07320, partial [Candidatus Eremiobacteraeota bacterium]|nr:hypothetical protein [Candidatus Eremiobacteraeota bacterium]